VLVDLVPVHRMHAIRVALRAELDPADAELLLVRGGRLEDRLGDARGEVEQLHRLAAREGDLLRVEFCHVC
jgi:hypothetical protein